MNVAQLTIEMAANVARLKTDMAAARNTVEGTMNSIKKAAGAAQMALGAIGVGLSVNAFAGWIKGAINAADEANKLSQKIGIAVKEIGGLQLAFSQGGVDAESMSSSLAKLNKNIAAGDSAFKTLGVATKNADGSLRSTTDVLADIADRFAGTENNANKTAMAIDLFGKSGAALIPVLNAGGSSIREFQVLAQQLGLTLSEETALAAEKFNDTLELIGMGSRGIANQVMAELLPTLQTLAGEFLNLMTQGGNLKGVADVISAGLKGLFTVAAVGVEIFRTLGNTIGATAAGIVAFASGDFSGAASVLKELGKDIRTNWTGTLESLDRLWNQSGNTAIEAAAKITSGSLQSGKAMEEAAKAAKKLAEEQDKARKAADDLVASIAFETQTMQMSNLEREIANNLLKLEKTGLQENTEEYRAYAEAIRLATIENEGIKQRIKLEKEGAEKRKKIEEDYAREVEQINFQIGQSLTDALINGGTTAKEFLINMFKTLILRPILQPIITGGTSAVMSLLGMGGTANAASGSAPGSLLNTSNLGSLASMASSVNNAYTALTTTTLGALDTIASGAQAATFAVGEGLSAMGFETAGTAVFSSAGTVGLAAQGMAGVGAGTMAGEWISGGKSLIGGNSLYTTAGGAAAGAAIGTMILPGIGSFVGGLIGGIVGGIANAGWGSGAKQQTGSGIQGTWTPTGLLGGQGFTTWEKKGGWFGGGGSGKDTQEINSELEAYMSNAVVTVANAAKTYADILGVNAEAIANVTHYFEIPANSVEELTKYLEIELKSYADQLATAILAGTDFGKVGETASDTLKRLVTNLSGVNSVFDTLNIKLFDSTLAGAAAASAFIDLMGGIEAFNQATDFYYQNFYTQAERTAKTTENLSKIFEAMNLELPGSRDAFKAMVEAARDAGDDVLLANLLKLAPTFASISLSAEQVAEGLTIQAQKLAEAARIYAQEIRSASDAIIEYAQRIADNLQEDLNDAMAATDFAFQRLVKALEVDLTNAIKIIEADFLRISTQIVGNIDAIKVALDTLNTASNATDAALSVVVDALGRERDARIKGYQDQFTELETSINAQIEEQQRLSGAANDSASSLKSLFDVLQSGIDSLYSVIGSEANIEQAFAFITNALATARTGGALPNQEDLARSISTATGGITSTRFGSSFEMRRAGAVLQNQLVELQGITGERMTDAQVQIKKADDQIILLQTQLDTARTQFEADVALAQTHHDEQVTYYQEQVNALRGIDTSVLTVDQAIAALNVAMTEEQRAATAVQNLILADQGLTREQLITAANLQIETLNAQLELERTNHEEAIALAETTFNEQVAYYQEQINVLRGIDTSVISVTQAISGLSAAISAESAAAAAAAAAQAEANRLREQLGAGPSREDQIQQLYYDILERAPDPEGLRYWVNSGLEIADMTRYFIDSTENRIQEVTRLYSDILRRAPDTAGLDFWVQQGGTLEQIAQAIRTSPEAVGLRGYASGGYYGGGLAMVGENGPELINFDNPGMVYNSAQTTNLISNSVSQEIRGLREDNKTQARAMVQLQNRMTRLLERWDGDGLPEERMVTA